MLNRNKDFNLTLNSFLKIWFSSTTDGNKDLVRLPVRMEMRRGKGGREGGEGMWTLGRVRPSAITKVKAND